ncbi:MAG: hypothetical protein RL653_1721 [Pseudomonadota bacterium]|jgi:sugar/nucleoside kinase (ribokinase family)
MSLLVVGSMAYDSVETPFGVREEVLGGSATFFSTSASFFTQVRAVAVVGEDFDDAHFAFLRSRGVDLSGVSKVPGRTFRWKGRYSFQLNEAQTLDTQLNVFQSFSPTLPEAYRDSEYVFLGNIHPELQAQVVEQVKAPKLIAMDTMNFWIQGSLPALKKTLARVDLLFVNDGEARQLAGEHNIVQAAKAILAMGPKRLVIKRGEYGALLFDQEHVFWCPAYPLAELFDPTGAGDSFAGGFMGSVAQHRSLSHDALRRAMVTGSVMGSFAVERFSLDRFRDLEKAGIHQRYRDFKRLTEFAELPA